MSKISEQKALEVYPLPKEETESTSFINQETFNSAKRTGYIVGYNQAMQDFLEKAVEWLQDSLDRRYVVRNFHTGEYYSIQDMIKDFKNYMQDESEN